MTQCPHKFMAICNNDFGYYGECRSGCLGVTTIHYTCDEVRHAWKKEKTSGLLPPVSMSESEIKDMRKNRGGF